MHASRALRRCAVPLLIAVLVAAGCSSSDKKDSASSSTTTSTVAAPKDIEIGAGTNDAKDQNVAVLQFMPASVSVAVGTPVNWKWSGTEPHSVTFLKPGQTLPDPGSDPTLFAPTPPTGAYDGTTFVNSGLVPLGPAPAPAFQMSFAKAGTYSYYCVIHPQMIGKIVVTDPGGKVDTSATVAQRRATDSATYIAEGRAAKAKLLAEAPTKVEGADGHTTWTVHMGISTAHTDVLAFSPTPVGVKAGDTVTFLNDSAAPHTASFNAPFQDPTDPRTDAAYPGASPQTLTATGFYNSGLLPPDAPPGAGPPLGVRSFSFVVPGTGSYSYVCLLHAPSGMTGVINVT